MPTTRQWEIQNSMFRMPVHSFFFDFLSAQNMVRVIEGKIKEMIWGETKINFELAGGSSYRG